MDKKSLIRMLREGLSSRQIATKTGKSQTTVRYWISKYNLKTSKPQFNKKEFRCKFCGEEDLNKFVKQSRDRKNKSVCKSCHSAYTIDRFRENKRKAVEYKGGKCKKCGYNKCVGALEFHHRDPDKKDPAWQMMRNRKFEKIKSELDKCDLLCSNCHREVHWML